jgi:hypothetical protein
MALITFAQVRADHPLLEAFAILFLTPRLTAVATFEMCGGRRHCILVVGSKLFNFESESQGVTLQDALLGFKSGDLKLG